MTVLSLAAVLAAGAGSALAASPATPRDMSVRHTSSSTDAVTTWRILLLIFRQTDTDYVDLNGVTRHLRAELPQSDIDALLAAMSGSIAPAVRQWSNNQAAWDVEVRYPSQPISRVARLDARSSWVDPSCISTAITQYFEPGYYDHVLVYWRSSDDAGDAIPSDGWGWASRSYDPDYGYATVTYPGWSPWNPAIADMSTQIWIHEWLHSVSWFYADLGYRMPLYDADGAAAPDYYPDKPPYPGWGTFYADLMNDRVLQGGVHTGIPADAWALGTIKGPNDTSDRVPPTTSVLGADDAWHSSPVTTTFVATDNVGGAGMSGSAAKTEYQLDAGAWTTGTSCTVAAPASNANDGAHTISYRSTDAAGNTETAKQVTVRIDTTTPAGSFALVAGAAITATTSVSGDSSVSDAHGPLEMRFSVDGKASWGGWQAYAASAALSLPAGAGAKTVHAQYRDAAGNLLELTDAITYAPPSGDVTAPTVGAAGGAGGAWYRTARLVTLTASDEPGGSGVASITYTLDGVETTVPAASALVNVAVLPNGAHVLTFHAADGAGNAGDDQTLSFTIDTAGPVTAAKATSGRRGRAIALRYSITDNLSPKATAIRIVVRNSRGGAVKTIRPTARSTSTWYTAKWTPKARGTYRYHVYAKDLAGNVQSKIGSARVVVR